MPWNRFSIAHLSWGDEIKKLKASVPDRPKRDKDLANGS